MTNGQSPDDRRVIDRHMFVPHYLAVLANGMVWSQSRFYLEHYGTGVNEVRLITVLAHSPGLTAKGLCDALVMNKSIVSRSLAAILEKMLIEERRIGTTRTFHLTAAGQELNVKIVRVALERERRLLSGFTPADKTNLLGYLARMYDNLENSVDQALMAADAANDAAT
jgi:DNA-binding MarR family transcriptional regulator